MKIQSNHPDRKAAFTLTELALCIAVVGIALTAIIGVLPSGLNVQKQNREDTLISQDAQFLMETIRSGALAIPDLTNQVDFILWRRTGAERQEFYFRGPNYQESLPGTVIPLTASWQVTALLGMPRYEAIPAGLVQNEVTAQFRTFSSPFSEKAYRGAGGRPDPSRLETALRYLVTSENQVTPTRPPLILNTYTNLAASNIVANQVLRIERGLSDLRLTFQWPVFRVGTDFRTGNSRRSYRSLLPGDRDLLTTNFLGTLHPAYRFNGGRTNAIPLLN
jgi:type II secretory pathway pseudopilin PulG